MDKKEFRYQLKLTSSHFDSINNGSAGEKEIFGTLLNPSVSAKETPVRLKDFKIKFCQSRWDKNLSSLSFVNFS